MPERGHLLLGIDLGSSGVKAVLLEPERGIVASSNAAVTQFADHPGWSEADPSEWWRALCALVPRLLDEAHAVAADISALAVSGMVPAVLLLDAMGRPLRRAMLQNDARATCEIRDIHQALGGLDLLGLSGSVLSQQSVAPSVLWIARHEPEVWAKATSIQGSYDWLARELGAEAHVEYNWALESGLYDFNAHPIVAMQEATSITWPAMLVVRRPGEVVGEVSVDAAAQTGLAPGTSIIVGGADHVLSAYGAGLVERGDVLVKLGGAGDVMAVADEVFLDRRLYLDSHPVPGKWMPNGCMATSGSLLRWEQSIFEGVSLVELDEAASASVAGALIALPYFLGEKTPLHDPDLRGVIVGLNLATTRGDIHRSFLEAIAYGFRSHLEIFAEGGLGGGTTRVTNGGSKSRLWREILADVLNRDLVSLVDHPGASFGAAVIAGVGTGAIADWSYVATALERGETISPNPGHVTRYDERYAQFVELGALTTPIAHALARADAV